MHRGSSHPSARHVCQVLDKGRLAQLVRAGALQALGRGFESLTAHQLPESIAERKLAEPLGTDVSFYLEPNATIAFDQSATTRAT